MTILTSIARSVVSLSLVGVLLCSLPAQLRASDEPANKAEEEIEDHTDFDELLVPFKTGDDVTRACLECHDETDEQLRKTQHWQWHVEDDQSMGKGGLVANNFCISSNKLGDEKCISCHIGWNGKQGEVNCLVCHSLKKMDWREAFEDISAFVAEGDTEALAMAADIRAELQASITAVGHPTAQQCGSCHFYSGGGDGVKRGDLDSSLVDPPRELDVHLSKAGAGLACRDCHNTSDHQVPGRQYGTSASQYREQHSGPDSKSFLQCEACHTATPHQDAQLNKHFDVIACQTCHIPYIGRGNPTKVWWDWSKAGKLKDGKPYYTKDEHGKKNYMTIKGEFRWEKNIVPHYAWYNGTMKNLTLETPLDREKLVDVQVPNGAPGEPNAKIHPFKVHLGRQPYDSKLNRLLAPMLSGDKGYWTTLDWSTSLKAGMEAVGLPFSGEYDFIESRFMYPVHHTIAPKEQALKCDDCHQQGGGATTGRLSGVPGIDLTKKERALQQAQEQAKNERVKRSWLVLVIVVLLIGLALFQVKKR
ncbi:tetrathionate reductase family octaheme c-type cytochrome [Oligoflexia bacterium]|nr:tetrathionate reductase family octaheme c-type cytochrome [Oligoflexia bacterium]